MTSVDVLGYLLKRVEAIINHQVVIDDISFRLHHSVTSPLLFICVFVSLVYKVLDPISCISTSEGLSDKAVNTYCLMQNTFILPDEIDKNIGSEIAHQGIDQHESDMPRTYQNYYQWVPILLLAQSVLFYISSYFWEKKERGITRNLLVGLDIPIPTKENGELMPADEIDQRVDSIASYLQKNRGQHKSYLIMYMCCTVFNLINVSLQIYFTVMFLNVSFFELGWKIFTLLNVDYNTRTDALMVIFPRMAKCSFSIFGVAGSVQTHDILCVLPFNLFYEMIFSFNMIWFTILAVCSLLAVIFWLANCCLLWVRVKSLQVWKSSADVSQIKYIVMRYDLGDWFILRLLTLNMSANHYSKLMGNIHAHLCSGPDTCEPLIPKIAST